MLKLNLGRFNRCVTYVEKTANYPVNPESIVFYYTYHDSDIVSKRVGDIVNVPIFDIAVAIKDENIDDPNVTDRLLVEMELNIFQMLNKIIKEYCRDFDFENILIPIREIHAFNENPKKDMGPRLPPVDSGYKGCYGWVEIGVAVVVPVKVKA